MFFKRSQFCFGLHTVMVIEVDHLVLRMEKKFSVQALSYGLPRLDMDGVMPYDRVRLKYACDVY